MNIIRHLSSITLNRMESPSQVPQPTQLENLTRNPHTLYTITFVSSILIGSVVDQLWISCSRLLCYVFCICLCWQYINIRNTNQLVVCVDNINTSEIRISGVGRSTRSVVDLLRGVVSNQLPQAEPSRLLLPGCCTLLHSSDPAVQMKYTQWFGHIQWFWNFQTGV